MSVRVQYEADIKKFETQLNSIEKRMSGVEQASSKSTKKIEKGFSSVDKTVNNFTQSVKGLGTAFIGAFAIEGLIQGAISEMKEMIAITQQFEKSFTNVLTLLNSNDAKQFREPLKQGAIDLMVEFGTSIEDTNKALFDAISAGVPAGDAIDFLRQNAILATGGVTDLSVAVDGTTSILNAYGLETDQTNKITNAFFTAQKFGKTTVEELASSVGNVAPIAKQAGIGFATLLGATSELTLGGLSTEESVTALQNAISSLLKPTDAARKVLEQYNVPIGASQLRSEGFATALQGLAKAAEENPDALSEMIPNIRAIRAIGGLTEEKLIDMDNIIQQINQDVGEGSSLMAAFAAQEETLAQKTERAEKAQEALVIALDDGTGVVSEILKSQADLTIGLTKARIETLRYADANKEELGPTLSTLLDLIARFGGELGGGVGQILIGATEHTEAFTGGLLNTITGIQLFSVETALAAEEQQSMNEGMDGFIQKQKELQKIINPNIDALEAMRLKTKELATSTDKLTIQSIKEQIAELTKQRDVAELNSDEFFRLDGEIKRLNALLPKTTKSTKQAETAFTLLQKQVANLKREIEAQAASGDVDIDTINRLRQATDRLTEAEARAALAIELTRDVEELKTKTITEETAKRVIEAEFGQEQLNSSLKDLYLEDIKNFKGNEKDKIQLIQEAIQDRVLTEKEGAQQIEEIENELQKKRKQRIAELITITIQAAQLLFTINNERLNNENIALDNRQRKEQKALEQRNLDGERFAKEQQALDEKFAKQRNALRVRQARADKAQAIFDAAINTASGVAKAIAASPLTLGLPWSAIVAALGAVQIATIAARPIPEFAKGTKRAPGGLSIVGEEGPELKYTEKGSKILPAKQTSQYANLIDAMMDNKLEDYINQYYVLPALQEAQKTIAKSTGQRMADGLFMQTAFNDKRIIRMQKKQTEILNGIYRNTKPDTRNDRNVWN